MTITLKDLQLQLIEQTPDFQKNCKAYLKEGGDINATTLEIGLSLLQLASGEDNAQYAINTIDFLMECKADIYCDHTKRPQPLVCASQNSKNPAPIVHCLLQHKADPNYAQYGFSVIDTAARWHSSNSKTQISSGLKALIEEGANPQEVLKSEFVDLETKKYIQDTLKCIEKAKNKKT